MTNKRTKAVGLAASLAALPLFLPSLAGANAGPGFTGSSDDPESYPPLPGECAEGQLWWQWTGDPNAQVLSQSNPFVVLPGIAVGAGHVTVTEAITWDARPVEQPEVPKEDVLLSAADETEGDLQSNEQAPIVPAPELYEKMIVKFLRNGEVVGSTPFHTPDLPDDNPYAWSVSHLGTIDLPDGADTVVLAHSSVFMPTDGGENSFLPKAVCIEVTPFEVEEPPTTTTPPPTTVTPTTVTPTTVTPTTVAPVEVLDEAVVAAPELAFTGGESVRNVGFGAALVAIGAGLLGATRRRRQHT